MRRARHGFTLLELLVAMAVMAVVVSVALRLLFLSDAALGRERMRSAATGAVARFLQDVGADVRSATGASASGASLVLAGPSRVRYLWDASQGATIRRVAGDTRTYPGVRPRFARAGSLVVVDAPTASGVARTACYMRRR
jgi:prepilin-type N-terminal cleavage/methylation domain-containing protein